MKKFVVVTLFPEVLDCWFGYSVVGRARGKVFDVEYVNPRDFATDNYRSVDDYMFGGGPGMLMRYNVIKPALDKAKLLCSNPLSVALTASGKPLTEDICQDLSTYDGDVVLLCGHYEGFDDRILDDVDVELSIGDFVLSGGELAAAAVVEAVVRLLPGFVDKPSNVQKESFSGNLLEEPQYTRPRSFQGKEVPDVLLSGHHERIEKWKREQRLKRTLLQRPKLLFSAQLSEEDLAVLKNIFTEMDNVKKAIFGGQ